MALVAGWLGGWHTAPLSRDEPAWQTLQPVPAAPERTRGGQACVVTTVRWGAVATGRCQACGRLSGLAGLTPQGAMVPHHRPMRPHLVGDHTRTSAPCGPRA